jgi:hypothetical protein
MGNLETRIGKLESAMGDEAWDLTLLTDAELIALESCLSEAVAAGFPVCLTPELEAAHGAPSPEAAQHSPIVSREWQYLTHACGGLKWKALSFFIERISHARGWNLE